MDQKSGIDSLLEALRASGATPPDPPEGSQGGASEQGAQKSAGTASGGQGARTDKAPDASAFTARGTAGSKAKASSKKSGKQGSLGDFADKIFAPFERDMPGRGGNGGNGGGDDGRQAEKPELKVPFVDQVATWGKRALTIAAIVLVVVLLCAYWWFHPPINLHSADTWLFLAIFVLLPCFIVFKTRQKNYEEGTKKVEKSPGKAKTFKFLSFIPLAIVAIGLVGGLLSCDFIPGNAKKYATILNIADEDFAEDMDVVNYSQVPIIDHAAAAILGNREMGTIADYVSQFEVNDLYSQINFQGTPVRVSPLDYENLIKWLFNRGEGLPAYVLVDMTTQEANVIRISDVDGTTGAGIKYSESEPLARNIQRYVQLTYPFHMFDQFSFEIDEAGHPWWVCPVQQRTIGLFGGTTIQSVVLCDAVTGECTEYDIEDCPEWVDRAYPSDLLIQQYNWYGTLNGGWINSWLGQSGVVKTTPGSDGLDGYNYIAKDDDVWVYTGVTSATADNSIVGFILINQRTAEAHFYSVVGATETSAMDSAEGLVQQYSYISTFPLLINVADRPTYFMALKDSSGYVKQFAMMDVNQINLGATGTTVAETQQAYLSMLASNGIDVSGGGGNASIAGNEVSGKIAAMGQAVIEGNSHYYVVLEGDDNIYDFALPAQLRIVMYNVGDTISMTFVKGSKTCAAELAD